MQQQDASAGSVGVTPYHLLVFTHWTALWDSVLTAKGVAWNLDRFDPHHEGAANFEAVPQVLGYLPLLIPWVDQHSEQYPINATVSTMATRVLVPFLWSMLDVGLDDRLIVSRERVDNLFHHSREWWVQPGGYMVWVPDPRFYAPQFGVSDPRMAGRANTFTEVNVCLAEHHLSGPTLLEQLAVHLFMLHRLTPCAKNCRWAFHLKWEWATGTSVHRPAPGPDIMFMLGGATPPHMRTGMNEQRPQRWRLCTQAVNTGWSHGGRGVRPVSVVRPQPLLIPPDYGEQYVYPF